VERVDEFRFAEVVAGSALAKLQEIHKNEDFSGHDLSAANRQRPRGRGAQFATPAVLLHRLQRLLEERGYHGCMILLDEVDNVDAAKGIPRVQREIVRPLLAQWYDNPFWRWRAFLPLALRPHFSSEHALSGQIQQWTLHWSDEDLRKIIEDRMLHHSQGRYETIGDLCEDDLSTEIDGELVALSQGNPRKVVLLAANLFREHCRQRAAPPPPLIRRATWETVRSKWELGGSRQAQEEEKPAEPPVEPHRPPGDAAETAPQAHAAPAGGVLRIEEGGGVWVGAMEITRKLNKHRYSILKLLYDHAGKVVTKEQIIDAGWPLPEYKDPTEVSDDMIRQQINHIRNILSTEIEYIESVPGRGYRLERGGKGLRRAKTVLPKK
jgi:hypothetical protein